MTLHATIEEILRQHNGCLMRVEEICKQNTAQKLYVRKDGKLPEPWQILMRLQHHLDKFKVILKLKQ